MLLAITAVFALVLSLEVQKWRNRKAIAEAVRQNNGIAHDELAGPIWLRRLVNDEGAFSQITDIEFGAGFAEFDPDNPIDDVHLRNVLAVIPAGTPLDYLGISRSRITDRSAPLIARLKIQQLNLDGVNGISDASIRHFSAIESLRDLSLEGTSVTDAGMSSLANLQNLNELDLTRTAITDDGLASLASLPRLTELILDETAVTDAGLTAFSNHRGLKLLAVRDTDVTSDGVKRLAKAMPGCTIASDH